MNRSLLFFFLFFIVHNTYTNFIPSEMDPSLTEWVDRWVEQWCSLPESDHPGTVNHLLNFLYISYERSHATIEVQRSMLRVEKAFGQSMYDIIRRRRNTSKQQEYPDAPLTIASDVARYTIEYGRYQKIMNYHAQVSEDILKLSALSSPFLTAHVADLHAYTRTVIMNHAYDIRARIKDLKGMLNTMRNCGIEADAKTRSLIDYVEEHFPILAFNSFVKIDNMSIDVTKATTLFLEQLQESAAAIWESIEQARGSLYQRVYQKIYTLAFSLGITPWHLYDLHQELVLENGAMIPLPHPDQWK